MIAAIYANSAWDEATDKNARKNAITGINENHREAIEAVEDAMDQKNRPEEEKLSNENPFFAAAERGLEKVEQRVKASGMKIDKPPEQKEVIDYMKGLDQE